MLQKKKVNWGVIVCYALTVVFLFLSLIYKRIGDMDELWNFSTALNLKKGLIPYKDFNIIVAPLSFCLSSIFLILFGETLIAFRIFTFCVFCLFLWLLKKIFDRLKINGAAYCVLLLLFSMILPGTLYEYNFLQEILLCAVIYFELGDSKKDKLLAPFFVGLTIINKQTTGAIIALVYIALTLFRKFYLKEDIRLKQIIQRLLIMIVPVCCLLTYLFLTGSFGYFYDLCIVGVKTFDNVSVDLLRMFICIILLISVGILWLFQKKDTTAIVFLFYSAAGASVIYPIMNMYHFIMAILPSFLYMWYFVNHLVDTEKKQIYLGLIGALLLLNGLIVYNNISINRNGTGIYTKLAIDEDVKNDLEEIDDFIVSSPEKVYILDFTSTLYTLPLGRYDKNFDLYMKGNFGIKGKEAFINKIITEDCIILINKSEDRNWQEPLDITDLVRNTYQQDGQIADFLVYKK